MQLRTMPQALTWPLRGLWAALSRLTDHQLRSQRSSVEDPERFRRVRRWAVARSAIVLVSVPLITFTTNFPWWAFVPYLYVLYLASRGAATEVAAAQQHLSGYLAGRSAMVHSLVEALNRDLNIEEWVMLEAERDRAIFMHAMDVDA